MSSPKKIKRTSQRTLRIFFPTLKVGSTDDQDSQLPTGKCENDTAASPENPRDEILKRGPRLQQRASNVTQNSKIFRGRLSVPLSKGEGDTPSHTLPRHRLCRYRSRKGFWCLPPITISIFLLKILAITCLKYGHLKPVRQN